MAIYFLIIANSIPIRKFYFHTKRLYTTSLHPKFSTKKKTILSTRPRTQQLTLEPILSLSLFPQQSTAIFSLRTHRRTHTEGGDAAGTGNPRAHAAGARTRGWTAASSRLRAAGINAFLESRARTPTPSVSLPRRGEFLRGSVRMSVYTRYVCVYTPAMESDDGIRGRGYIVKGKIDSGCG